MKIEFFTDHDGCHNARFHGGRGSTNEIIVGIFYDFVSDQHVDDTLNQMSSFLDGKADEFEFGDCTDIDVSGDYTILSSGLVTSKKYKIKTKELESLIKKWRDFRNENKANIAKIVDVKADVV